MTTQPQEGGRRAIDRVLRPEYVDDLASVPMPELRRRRQETEQEETDLSYARRLLQGRLDLLRAELSRRAGDDPGSRGGVRSDAELAEQLGATLADGPRQDHGLGRYITTGPSRVGEHRRAAEQAVADVGASDPSALDDDALMMAIEQVADLESELSTARHRVQQVMDLLTAEVTRRYREGLASVDEVLVHE